MSADVGRRSTPAAAGGTRPVHRGWRVLAGLHAIAVSALAVAAFPLYGMYCENVGCIGRGVLWFAWVCGSVVVLAMGLLAVWRLRSGAWARLTATMLLVQLLPGLWLLGQWWQSGPAGL